MIVILPENTESAEMRLKKPSKNPIFVLLALVIVAWLVMIGTAFVMKIENKESKCIFEATISTLKSEVKSA